MAPKKAAAQPVKAKVDAPACGLTVESCPVPLWDDAENDKEAWGDLGAAHIDPSQQFTDGDAPPTVAAFAALVGLDWRRPGGVFSPFKPVVVRPAVAGNPYEYVPPPPAANGDAAAPADDDEDDSPQPQSRSAMIELYRAMKQFRSVGADDESGSPARRSHAAAAAAAAANNKRRDRNFAPTPFFMRAFNSALMTINQAQAAIPAGQYAWELIYPKQPGSMLPVTNPAGKYAVKLFFGGAFRRVVIDDRLPTDGLGQCILTVTESKEIWPALLAKAMLKVLGPEHESLLFASPTFAVQTLLCGWAPQHVAPKREEALAFRAVRDGVSKMRAFREHIALTDAAISAAAAGGAAGGGSGVSIPASSAPNTPGVGQRPSPAVMIATCNDTASSAAPPPALVEEHSQAAGLQAGQAFYIMDMRPFQNTNLVRLVSPGAAWKGSYSYDSASWTAEVEEAIGFVASRDRDAVQVARKWTDFWMPWDSFIKFFATLSTFSDTLARDLAMFKQITFATDPPVPAADAAATPAAAKPAKGAAAAAAPAAPVDCRPRTITRWVCFNFDAPTDVRVAITGLPQSPDASHRRASDSHNAASTNKVPPSPGSKSQGGDGSAGLMTTSVAVSSYDWRGIDPFVQVLSFSTSSGLTATKTVRIGAGQRAYRIVATDVYNGIVVSVMAGHDFAMGDQKEICRDALGVHTVVDAGMYGEHRPHVRTIWFKRFISVKQAASAQFAISTLPKGTDLAAHRQLPQDAGAGAGGKGAKAEKPKPPAKGAKGAAVEAPTAEALNDLIDDEPHEKPMLDLVRLYVLDLETGKATSDTVGRIMNFDLQPTKGGYIVMASATTPEAYGRGYWKLECTADKPIDVFEARAFEELQAREGHYQSNDLASLFRYTIVAGEAATTSIQLNLGSGAAVPVTLSLFHNDKLIEQRESVGEAQIEHASLVPSDKAAPSTYAIQCTVDKAFLTHWAALRRQQVVALYRAETAAQLEQLTERQHMLREMLAADPTVKPPSATGADGADGAASGIAVDALEYTLTFHSSSPKIEVKEDSSVNEAANAIKQSWSRKDEAAAAPAGAKGAAAKPGKGAAVVDESAARFAKAKEARERFLANRHGVFMPAAQANGKVVLQPSDDEAGHRYAPPAPVEPAMVPARLHQGFTADGAGLHGGVDGTDYNRKLENPSPVTAKPDIKATLERLQGDFTNGLREDRKAATAAINDSVAALFAELRPGGIGEQPPVEADDKKKGATAGKKK